MATISDIKSWTVGEENITGNVGDTNLVLVTTDFHSVATIEVTAPAQVAVIDVGVVGLGSSGGGSGAVDSVNGETGVVVLNQDEVLDGTTYKQYSAAEKTKLAGISTGATANATDAQLRDRTTHTGSQAISTVTGLQTALDGKQALDSDLTAIAALSPTNDDVVQRKAGAWTNRTPAQLKTDLALAKGDVGLGNVDNTSDANKPVSTATQTALNGKQALDTDLTTIAGLAPAANDVMQYKSGAWANRTIAQLKTDLAIAQSDVSGLSTLLGLGWYFADGTTSTNARPSVPGKVIWVGGTTQPVNMTTGDLWIKA